MLLGIALAVLSAQGQAQEPGVEGQEKGVTTGIDRENALRIQLTGHVDLHYLYRSDEIDQAGGILNGLGPPPPGTPENFWAGRISLRADIDVKDFVSGVIELENRSYENGMNKPFSFNNPDVPIEIKQGYIEVGRFLSPQIDLRIGVQNLTLRNRPQDEPFFMDLGESEGFFRGFQPVGKFISNTVDRDIGQATGVRFFYSPGEIATLQGFWMTYTDGSGTPKNESIYGVVANSLLGENWSSWLLVVAVKGNGDQLGVIETFGAGVDGYLDASKDWEVFVEAYGQTGTLTHPPAAVRKEAYAYNAGARWLGLFNNKFWIEAADSWRSGDRHPGATHDQAFQSYENVNRFLIMESSEFGLDIDTDITCARAALGVGPFEVMGRPFRIQCDEGWFTAVAPIQSVAATGNARRWGLESDLSFIWDYNSSFSLSLRGAWLADSQILSRLTGDDHAWLVLFSANLNF